MVTESGNPQKSRKRSRLSAVVLGVAVSGIALWLSFRKVDMGSVAEAFERVQILPLALTLITSCLGFCLMAVRSQLLFKSLGLNFITLLKAHFVGYIGNTLVPFRLGELLRLDYLARISGRPHASFIGGVVVERLLDLGFVILCFTASIPLTTGAISQTTGIVLLSFVVMIGLLLFIIGGKRPQTMRRVMAGIASLFGARILRRLDPHLDALVVGLEGLSSIGNVIAVCMVTITRWGCTFIAIRLWLWAFDVTLEWYAPIVLFASLAFGTALPSASAFIGTYHYALSAGLSLLGVGPSLALSIAIVAHAVSTIPYMVIGSVVVGIELVSGRWTPGIRRVVGEAPNGPSRDREDADR